MLNISPLVIISLLGNEQTSDFRNKIDKQFTAFGLVEFDNFNVNHHKWWNVITINDIPNFMDVNKHPHDIPIFYSGILFDRTKLIIFVVGDSSDNNFNAILLNVKNLHSNNMLMGGAGACSVYYYGIVLSQNSENKKEEVKNIYKVNNFDSYDAIIPVDKVNMFLGNNQNGYNNLSSDDFLEQSKQLIFHFSLCGFYLSQTALTQTKKITSAGTYTLTYEPNVIKNYVARDIAGELINKYCFENKDVRWCLEEEANNRVKIEYHNTVNWKNIFVKFSSGFNTTDLSKSIFKKPSTSPWALFAARLIPDYFMKYIRYMPTNIREAGRLFSQKLLFGFNNHLDEQLTENLKETLLNGEENPNSKKRISTIINNIWSSNNNHKNPVGLQHILLVLKNIREYIEKQIEITTKLEDNQAPKDSELFPNEHDYPIKNIPKQLQSYYIDFIRHGEPDPEIQNPALKGTGFEEDLIKQLVDKLEYHPIPLALFTRAIFLGATFMLVIFTFLKVFPDFIFNTSFMEKGIGSVITIIILFLIPFGFALYKYGVKTILAIKNLRNQYLAWVLYKTQKKAYLDILSRMKIYYSILLTECSRIENNINGFITICKSNGNIEEYLPKKEFMYPQTFFQRDILSKFDGQHQILADNILNLTIEIKNSSVPMPNRILDNSNNQVELFNEIFLNNIEEQIINYNGFYNQIIVCENPEFSDLTRNFCELLTIKIESKINLINAENILHLLFENAPDNEIHKLNIQNQIPTLIKSRFYPSFVSMTITNHREFSFILPMDINFNVDNVATVFTNGANDNQINYSSLISIGETIWHKGPADFGIAEQDTNNQTIE